MVVQPADPFVSQIFADVSDEYDLLVLSDGNVIVPVELREGYHATVRVGEIAKRPSYGPSTDEIASAASNFVGRRFAEPSKVTLEY